ncbi:MAG: class I SAM-dependent methyltransferase [Roseimicrobium sp.]
MQPCQHDVMRAVEDDHWWYAVLRRQVLKTLSQHLPRYARVLDAGCGTGGMMRQLPARWTSIGVDSALAAVQHTRARGLHALLGSVNDLPFGGASFDAVLSLDVLYHKAVQPARAMAEITRVLKPGGVLILNVPAFSVLRGSHDRSVSGARRYNTCQVQGLLARHNLMPDMIHYWNTWLFLPLLLRRLLSRVNEDKASSDLHLPPLWLNRLLTLVGHVDVRVARALCLPVGSSVFAVAIRQPV